MPRRVADRSVAMRGGILLGLALGLLAVLGGVGGALYYYKARGFAARRNTPDRYRSEPRRRKVTRGRTDTARAGERA